MRIFFSKDNSQVAGPSGIQNKILQKKIDKVPTSCLILPSEISPLPKATNMSKKRKRNGPSKYGVLNTTPEIERLKMKTADKNAELLRKEAKKMKSKVFHDTDPKIKPASRKTALIANSLIPTMQDKSEIEISDDENDTACIFCNELFSRSKPNEEWICCLSCKKWAHCECAGCHFKTKQYICDLCV